MQRVEGQFQRDLTLPFSLWNLVFRTVVNIGSNLRAVTSECFSDSGETISGKVFRDAATTLLNALDSSYVSGGRRMPVAGDLQKAKLCASVQANPVAVKMLNSLQSTFKVVEGTQEVRTIMRHELTSYRVFYGVPIMVTFSPAEKHSLKVLLYECTG